MTFSELANTELTRAEARTMIEGQGLRFADFADEVGEASHYLGETVISWLGL